MLALAHFFAAVAAVLLGGLVSIRRSSAAAFFNIAGGGYIGRTVVQLTLHVVPEHLGVGFAIHNFKL